MNHILSILCCKICEIEKLGRLTVTVFARRHNNDVLLITKIHRSFRKTWIDLLWPFVCLAVVGLANRCHNNQTGLLDKTSENVSPSVRLSKQSTTVSLLWIFATEAPLRRKHH